MDFKFKAVLKKPRIDWRKDKETGVMESIVTVAFVVRDMDMPTRERLAQLAVDEVGTDILIEVG